MADITAAIKTRGLKMKNLILILMFGLSLSAHAAETETATRYAGKMISDNRITLQQKLAQSPVVRNTANTAERRQLRSSGDDSAHFRIFDAWVELSGDDDYDGYFHRIKTSFDADVDTPLETVYAKLYLSYQGGPWVQFADTELFEIRYDSMSDSYEVETELLEGYASGDYDVLIELHSLYHPGVVASAELYQDSDGYPISLEDRERDRLDGAAYSVSTTTYTSVAGDGYLVTEEEYIAGSLSWPGLFLLALLVLIKWRYFAKRKAI